jgi:hypothetical protein
MRKAMVIGFLALALAAGAGDASGGISLKLTLGANPWLGGDFNRIMRGMNDFYNEVWATNEGAMHELRPGLCGRAEIVFDLSPRIGLGLEASYVRAAASSAVKAAMSYDPGAELWERLALETEADSFPIFANVHYRFPPVGRLTIDAIAGAGLILTSLSLGESYEYKIGGYRPRHYIVDTNFESFRANVGFQTGLGMAVPLSPRLSLAFDVLGQYAKRSGFKGTLDIEGRKSESYLWYGEEDYGGTSYPVYIFGGTEPASYLYGNARKASTNAFAITAAVGIKFDF